MVYIPSVTSGLMEAALGAVSVGFPLNVLYRNKDSLLRILIRIYLNQLYTDTPFGSDALKV